MRRMAETVLIRELAPREGFQILKRFVPTQEKLAFIAALTAAGLREIEVTSFVRADRVPQLADCDEVAAALSKPPLANQNSKTVYRALCLNAKGFERSLAFSALDHAAWFYTGASDTFLTKNSNTTFEKQLAAVDAEWFPVWRRLGQHSVSFMISNAFGCSYEGAIDARIVISRCELLRERLKAGGFAVQELSLADTVGLARGDTTQALVAELSSRGFGKISLHMHDTHGHALECLEAGLASGVRVVESSVAGLGGCPFTAGAAGNVATEEVVQLCRRLGLETGVDSDALAEPLRMARAFLR